MARQGRRARRVGESADGALSLGATLNLEDAAPLLGAIHPDLSELLRRFGSKQVRASGTVGGNIANGSPIGDLAPALIALGGRVVLRKGDKTRALPLEDFFIAYGKQDREPGEFVLAVEAPRLAAHQHYRAFKVSKRFDEDISAVMLAVRIDLDGRRIVGARVACGGMAATPKRAEQAEQALVGANLDQPASWRRGPRRAIEGFHSAHRHARERRLSHDGRRQPSGKGAHGNLRRWRADPDWNAPCRRMMTSCPRRAHDRGRS